MSPAFVTAIDQVFSKPVHLIATIRQGDDWTVKYTSQPGAILLPVTNNNRDNIKMTLRSVVKALDIYDLLSSQQQIKVATLATNYVSADQFVQLNKLFNNAIKYIAEGKISKMGEGLFVVRGDTNSHRVSIKGITWQCDCDLYKGTGQYVDAPGECSHIQAAKIILA